MKIRVNLPDDRLSAARSARDFARELGFNDTAAEEVGLAVSELASNIARHADSGELILDFFEENERKGIQVTSRDRGPGIVDINRALADGYSTKHGLGYGLGCVNRLMDELHFERPGTHRTGNVIICRKWLPLSLGAESVSRLDIGAATRPMPGSKINGDAYLIKRWGPNSLVAVIDGLGHGQYAHRASQKALNYIKNHFDQPFPNIFTGVGRECLTTRGVVMALALFQMDQKRLTFASVGNIETRLINVPPKMTPGIRRGILGHNAPRPMINQFAWKPEYIMVLHSDGIRSHWDPGDIPAVSSLPPQAAAKRLLDNLAKENDDAVVVVIKGEKV